MSIISNHICIVHKSCPNRSRDGLQYNIITPISLIYDCHLHVMSFKSMRFPLTSKSPLPSFKHVQPQDHYSPTPWCLHQAAAPFGHAFGKALVPGVAQVGHLREAMTNTFEYSLSTQSTLLHPAIPTSCRIFYICMYIYIYDYLI